MHAVFLHDIHFESKQFHLYFRDTCVNSILIFSYAVAIHTASRDYSIGLIDHR